MQRYGENGEITFKWNYALLEEEKKNKCCILPLPIKICANWPNSINFPIDTEIYLCI